MTAVKWRVEEYGTQGRKVIVATCPGCGRDGTLPASIFHVEIDGRLVPSFDCPHCPFHEWVVLDPVPQPVAAREVAR